MIKALIFDAGGVVFNSSVSLFQKPIEYISDLISESVEKVDKAYREAIVECESRTVSKQEIWEAVMRRLGKDVPYSGQDPIEFGFKSFKLDEGVVSLVKKLRSNCKVALVSNANAVESSTPQAQSMYKFFDVVDLSYKIGVRKPSPGIYENAFKKLGAKPNEIIFVDNAPENVEEAKKLGMVGILFKNAEQLKEDLEKVGVVLY